jgi:daunorubicin resistance ABC transporter ATP-binding subunit
MADTMIEVAGVKKAFGTTKALCGVDLTADRAKVLGLLGPNGAGKTTLVRILATLLAPDEGYARIGGLDVVHDAAAIRPIIGLAGQYAAVDETLTGRENIELVGRLYHLGRADVSRRADEVLERFSLTNAADRQVKTYSGGMRRRLDLGASLVARPPVIILDEPTTGLDPRSRVEMWGFIESLVADGTTILLTTQYLDEADRLAHQIVVIDYGKVIAEGTADELKDQLGGDVVEVRVASSDDLDKALAAIAGLEDGTPQVDR